MNVRKTEEYKLISEHYGDRTARRSGVPLMNHIREGLELLNMFGASDTAKQAFCLHPLLQGDMELGTNVQNIALNSQVNPKALTQALLYREAANRYLCSPMTDPWGPATATRAVRPMSLSPHVYFMLCADKLQNQKDFDIYHKDTHPRSKCLAKYFKNWLTILGVVPEEQLAFRQHMIANEERINSDE
ncbi:hypothetical protein Knedl_CDS0063 [Pseudomonas phage Knedl]|nr:hypothetical protein Knedl_CDS0063 [Pseudomonas phage Knedl]